MQVLVEGEHRGSSGVSGDLSEALHVALTLGSTQQQVRERLHKANAAPSLT